jgi:diguanylate cyclase
VFSVHFLAMAGTGFRQDGSAAGAGPIIGNESLAMLVTLSAFVISAAFLLTGVTFARAEEADGPPNPLPDDPPTAPSAPAEPLATRIPYERENRIFFLDGGAVVALRAEGHYTMAYHGTERLFCPWSISEAERRLAPSGFLRVHRSYLVNPRLVTGFERMKDTGVLYFEGAGQPLEPRGGTRGAWPLGIRVSCSQRATRANLRPLRCPPLGKLAARLLSSAQCGSQLHRFGRST